MPNATYDSVQIHTLVSRPYHHAIRPYIHGGLEDWIVDIVVSYKVIDHFTRRRHCSNSIMYYNIVVRMHHHILHRQHITLSQLPSTKPEYLAEGFTYTHVIDLIVYVVWIELPLRHVVSKDSDSRHA